MRKIILIAILGLLALPLGASAETPSVPESRQQITLSFAPLVKQAAPAVVNIYTERLVQQRTSPLFADPFFRQFFGNMLPPGFDRQRLENSLGSGVIVRPDGLIVTSNHVIRDADQIRVVLSDRREFPASVVTTDEHSDIAVLHVDVKSEKLPFLELKDSDEAEIGDLVLAIGNPFGVGQTVTSGIISAVAHGAVGSSDLDYFIQTDAAINPGNSGGALVTMDGKLVGVNTAIYSRDGGNMGIGFAVPSNMVRVVMNAVQEGRKTILRPWLGIGSQEVTPELASSMNMAQPAGVLVNSVHSDSPAAKAGLRVGDVIVAINGRAIEDAQSFHYRVATLPVGSTATFGIQRKGQKSDIPVILIAPPETPARERTTVTGNNPLAGAVIENLSPAVIEENNIHGIEHGVVITAIKDGSVVQNIGLQPGDVVVSVNGDKVSSVNDVLTFVKRETHSWRVTVQRGDNNMTIVVAANITYGGFHE